MKKWMLVGSVCALVFTACDKNDDVNPFTTNETDRDYVAKASISNNAEIMAGQLAATKGNNALVRNYGQSMVTEHTAAQTDLRVRLASISLYASDTVDAEHRMKMATLNSLSGRAFDSAYIIGQVADHQKAINLFTNEKANGQNATIKGYATQYLPPIEHHYMLADSIRRVL